LYLEEQVNERMAAAAADGWGGDRYAVYHHRETGSLVLVLRIAWDSAAEADEFASTYLASGPGRFGFSADDGCWEGDDAICLFQSGEETLIIRAPDLDTINAISVLFPAFE